MFPYLKWSLWDQNPKKFILSAEHCAKEVCNWTIHTRLKIQTKKVKLLTSFFSPFLFLYSTKLIPIKIIILIQNTIVAMEWGTYYLFETKDKGIKVHFLNATYLKEHVHTFPNDYQKCYNSNHPSNSLFTKYATFSKNLIALCFLPIACTNDSQKFW